MAKNSLFSYLMYLVRCIWSYISSYTYNTIIYIIVISIVLIAIYVFIYNVFNSYIYSLLVILNVL